MRTVLILEDKPEHQAEFERLAPTLGEEFEVLIWDDANRMRSECERFLPRAALISLEHDLDCQPGTRVDPGSGLDMAKFLGLDMAKFLAEKRPVCPVIVHTSNTDRSYSILNELRFADWRVDRVGQVGQQWIEKYWTAKAKELLVA
jgi:hypothetical protein